MAHKQMVVGAAGLPRRNTRCGGAHQQPSGYLKFHIIQLGLVYQKKVVVATDIRLQGNGF